MTGDYLLSAAFITVIDTSIEVTTTTHMACETAVTILYSADVTMSYPFGVLPWDWTTRVAWEAPMEDGFHEFDEAAHVDSCVWYFTN